LHPEVIAVVKSMIAAIPAAERDTPPDWQSRQRSRWWPPRRRRGRRRRPTSCRSWGPVTSPTDALAQTIYLCGISYASSLVTVTGPSGESIELTQSADCPLTCPDSRQQCAAANVALLPGVLNAIEVCQVPGIGCGPLPDLCVDVEIAQRAAADGIATP
jgi:hypothetical protein